MTKKMPDHIRNDPVLSYFWRRLYYYDQNILMIVCGGTGTCKSGSALSVADMMDRDKDNKRRFSIDRVVFKAEDFVQTISSELPKGSVVIWDEIGVEHDSRNYYTLKNKLIKYVLQTFRYKNLMLIMTVPDLRSVDIGARRLLHCYLETRGPLKNKRMAIGRLEFVQVNPKTGKEYFKRPRFFGGHSKKGLQQYYIPKPAPDLENPYKRKKIRATKQWYENFNEQLVYMEGVIGEKQEQRKAKIISINEYASLVMQDPLRCYDMKKKKFVPALIEAYLDEEHKIVIGRSKTCSIARLMTVKLEKEEISF